MRLLVISAAFPPMRAGEAEHIYHQCRDLARRGFEVHVLVTDSLMGDGNNLVNVRPLMRDWSWTDLPRFARFVRECAPDAILVYYIGWIYNEHPMITFAPTVCKRIFPQCRLVTMFAYPHGSRSDRFSALTRAVRKAVAKWAGEQSADYEFGTLLRDSDAIIVLSDSHREAFASRYAGVDKKTILIPPPPLLSMAMGQDETTRMKTRKAFGIDPEHFLIAYFGYLYPSKGVETILRAFYLVSRTQPRARLMMIGGELARNSSNSQDFGREMRELSRHLGCEDKVIWTGAFSSDGDEASRYLYAADAGVFAHDLGVAMNNSSFAALMAHGLPTVATRGRTVEAPILSGNSVLLCPPKSPEAMAQALLTLLDSEELRDKLRRGALNFAAEWFSWDKATDRVIQTLSTN